MVPDAPAAIFTPPSAPTPGTAPVVHVSPGIPTPAAPAVVMGADVLERYMMSGVYPNVDGLIIRVPDQPAHLKLWTRTGSALPETPPAGEVALLRNSTSTPAIWSILQFEGKSDPDVFINRASYAETPLDLESSGWTGGEESVAPVFTIAPYTPPAAIFTPPSAPSPSAPPVIHS